jgi:protein phosphatase
VATWLVLRSQYYVAAATGSPETVAVYRGVSGSVIGIDLSSVADRTDIPVSALPTFRQSDVADGIQAKDRSDAERIVANLRQEACAKVRAQRRAAIAAAKKSKTKSKPTPPPLPAYCTAQP